MNKFKYSNGVEVAIFPPMKRLIKVNLTYKAIRTEYGDTYKEPIFEGVELAFPHTIFATFPCGLHNAGGSDVGGFIFAAFSNKPIIKEDLEAGKCELWASPFSFFLTPELSVACVNLNHKPITNVDDGIISYFNNHTPLTLIRVSNTSLRTVTKWRQLTKDAGNDLSFITKVDWAMKAKIPSRLKFE